jgi:hypothetical protein
MQTALLSLGAFLFLQLAQAIPVVDPRQTTSPSQCTAPGAFHIIVARGSTEPQGEGELIQVSDMIEAAVPGSDSVAVVYPAQLLPYGSSEDAGVRAMTQLITQYVASCPNSRIVLLGYSQGGQIIGDVLGGATYSDFPPLNAALGSKIAAAVMFGNPAHVSGKSYNAGTADDSGIFRRRDTTVLDRYAGVLRSICDENDLFCDSGFSVSVHTSTVERNAASAAAFVISKK